MKVIRAQDMGLEHHVDVWLDDSKQLPDGSPDPAWIKYCIFPNSFGEEEIIGYLTQNAVQLIEERAAELAPPPPPATPRTLSIEGVTVQPAAPTPAAPAAEPHPADAAIALLEREAAMHHANLRDTEILHEATLKRLDLARELKARG